MPETISLSVGQFYFLAALAIYGLVMGGVALAVGISSIWQRHTMWREMRQFVRMMERVDHEPSQGVLVFGGISAEDKEAVAKVLVRETRKVPL